MPGTLATIGPWGGGLNTFSDAGAIADNELVVCTNFDIDPDGSLRTRPPFVDRGVAYTLSTSGGDPLLLGMYTRPSDGTQIPIASSANNGTFYYNGSAWVSITSTISAVAVVEFLGLLYLLAPIGSANPGGTWDGTTFTANSTMPKGTSMTIFRNRIWVAAGGTLLQYSGFVADGTLWTIGTPYGGTLNINAGDGQTNVALLVMSNFMLIFRTNSIWNFSYASDPAFGIPQVQVLDVGLSDPNAVRIFENTVYFMWDGKAYILNGPTATQLNIKVPFVATSRAGVYLPNAVSVVGRRVIFTYYDTMYVWSLRSHTWTVWYSTAFGGIGRILQIAGASLSDNTTYIAHSNISAPTLNGVRSAKTLFFTDTYSSEAEVGGFTAAMQTKIFDYASPARFKRLFWWGADLVFRTALTAAVIPITYSSTVTWGSMLSKTWGQSLSYTWGQSDVQANATTTQVVSPLAGGAGPLRKFVKLQRSLRARRLYYRLSLPVDGSSASGPARIFAIETFVGLKEVVSKQVS